MIKSNLAKSTYMKGEYKMPKIVVARACERISFLMRSYKNVYWCSQELNSKTQDLTEAEKSIIFDIYDTWNEFIRKGLLQGDNETNIKLLDEFVENFEKAKDFGNIELFRDIRAYQQVAKQPHDDDSAVSEKMQEIINDIGVIRTCYDKINIID